MNIRTLGIGLLAASALCVAQEIHKEKPLQALPYTPSLDVKAMDRNANPCVDFYQYSCGGWRKNNPIPADQGSWSVYGKLADENEQYLWGILEDAAKPSANRTPVEREIGDYFAACMDQPAIDKAGIKPLEPVLQQISRIQSLSDLSLFVATEHLRENGGGLMFGFGSNQDFGNSSQVIAFAAAGGLGLPDRDYYTKTDSKSQETRAKYVKHVAKMLELSGDSPAAAAAEAKTVMSIETDLAKASLTNVEKRDPYNLYHKVGIAKFKTMAPSFEWEKYLGIAGLPNVQQVNVTEPRFFEEFNTLLKSRSLDDWKAYVRWHVVSAEAPYLSKPFAEANFAFYGTYLRGIPQMEPRWKRCVQYVDRDLGEALGQEFVAKAFPPEAKRKTVEITRQIEAAMGQEIHQLPWMDDATKQQALVKLHAIVNKVGYPDRWRDYSSIRINRGDFLGNVNRAAIFESKRQIAKIGKPVDRGEWDMTPPTVNAYYNPQMNDINFPAGVLLPPLFDMKMDDAPNYGNTGSTIGHELTHGFDDEGRQFDAQGNLRDWWTKKDAMEFEKRTKCVLDQYGQYKVIDDIRINSKLTLGEDVADLGGTLLAYIAWKQEVAGKDLKNADGLSPDQRFFVGMAQWACTNERDETKRLHALTDPHSPPEYRINGVVSNLPQFSRAFACKAGQPMVREDACKIW